MFAMSLEDRQRRAVENRRRYWENASDRLHRINKMRERRGMPVVASLDDVATRGSRM